jgi:hypothetical protein
MAVGAGKREKRRKVMVRDTYKCKCGGTLSFNYDAWPSSAWQCDRCNFETSHVRVEDGDIHPNTFLPEYGAGTRRERPTDKCLWADNESGVWDTDCGEAFFFENGGPIDNKLRFCGFCGKALKERQVS